MAEAAAEAARRGQGWAEEEARRARAEAAEGAEAAAAAAAAQAAEVSVAEHELGAAQEELATLEQGLRGAADELGEATAAAAALNQVSPRPHPDH